MKAEIRSALLMVLATVIWGFSMAFQRIADENLMPFTFLACRYTLGTLCVLAAAICHRKKHGKPLCPRDAFGGIMTGLTLFIAAFLQQASVGEAGAGKAGFLTALYCVLVPILGIFIGKKTKWITWLALLIALPGLYLLCVPEGERISLKLSDTLLLISAFIWSAQILLTDRFAPSVPPFRFCFFEFGTASVLAWIATLAQGGIDWRGVGISLTPILYCGILSTAVGFSLQTIGQKDCPPALAALILCLESVFCVIAGAIMLGETMTFRAYMGCGLMLFAVLIAQTGDFIKVKKVRI